MNVLEELLRHRYIIKSDDRDKYYQIKDGLTKELREFLEEKLGYRLIINPLLVKLEKLPGKPEPFMGIQDFKDKLEYAMLCLILMFLEERSAEEQFVLSQLTEYVQANYAGLASEYVSSDIPDTLKWISLSTRRAFIRVMKFCESNGFFRVNDGDAEGFIRDADTEVLYEATGVSRYFARHFTRDIMDYSTLEDFETNERPDEDDNRGINRRHRVYRKIILSPCVVREGDDDEVFKYIRNQRNTLERDMDDYLNCELDIHQNCAVLIENGDLHFSRKFPERSNLSDITLNLFSMLRTDVLNGKIFREKNDTISIEYLEFTTYISTCKRANGTNYGSTFQKMSEAELAKNVLDYMASMGLCRVEDDTVIISPLAGKVNGGY